VLSRRTVQLLDRISIEVRKIPGIVLMENAGTACARLIERGLKGGRYREPVLVLAGPGNNGGDGFVIARHLHNTGRACEVALLGEASRLRPRSDARLNLDALRGTEVPFLETSRISDGLLDRLERAGCVVDALFGTGLDRPLRGVFVELFDAVSAHDAPVFAVDLPSGLDAESGQVLGTALGAVETATFVAAKPGLFRGEGPRLTGAVTVVPISIPRDLLERAVRDENVFTRWAEDRLEAV
jgi:NAD(P)H-hydrate epimerase